jgi:PEP-CTERM motif
MRVYSASRIEKGAWFAAMLVGVTALCAQAQAQNGDIVAQWTFEDPNTPADLSNATDIAGIFPAMGTGTASGHHANAATDWSTPAGNGSVNSLSSNTWGIGDYYQFQTSTLGLDEIGLIVDHVSSSTGPRDFQMSYSTDGTSFTDFGSPYMVRVNPGWAPDTTVIDLDTYAFDLRTVTALNNQANVYFRLLNNSTTSAGGATVAAGGTSRVDNVTVFSNFVPPDEPPPPPTPRLPRPGDVVLGLNLSTAATTLELASGPVEMDGAEYNPGPWSTTPFIQSVEFDNLGGIRQNASGNLLGVDFGNATNGGLIRSFATESAIPAPDGQLIGNTRAAPDNVGHDGSLALTRLSGLSVSPDNTKIALTGFDNGRVIVYDYTAGDTMGSGAALSGGRQSVENTVVSGFTSGTAWLDNDTVLAFSTSGTLFEVDANTMTPTQVGSVTTPSIGSNFSSLAYNPEVSPYVFAAYSGFSTMATPNEQSLVYILDPANNYSLVNEIVLNESLSDTLREIGLDDKGNLFIGVRGSEIEFIPNVDVNPAAIADNSSIDWYDGATFSNFNGLAVGLGEVTAIPGDHNNDGRVDAADYVVWRKNNIDGQQGYNDWRANFGRTAGSGSALDGAAAVPEPASMALVLLALVGVCGACRRA